MCDFLQYLRYAIVVVHQLYTTGNWLYIRLSRALCTNPYSLLALPSPERFGSSEKLRFASVRHLLRCIAFHFTVNFAHCVSFHCTGFALLRIHLAFERFITERYIPTEIWNYWFYPISSSYLILSYLPIYLSYLVLSCLILSCLVLSCLYLYLVFSYFVLSYLVLSYLILSYFLLSYLILPSFDRKIHPSVCLFISLSICPHRPIHTGISHQSPVFFWALKKLDLTQRRCWRNTRQGLNCFSFSCRAVGHELRVVIDESWCRLGFHAENTRRTVKYQPFMKHAQFAHTSKHFDKRVLLLATRNDTCPPSKTRAGINCASTLRTRLSESTSIKHFVGYAPSLPTPASILAREFCLAVRHDSGAPQAMSENRQKKAWQQLLLLPAATSTLLLPVLCVFVIWEVSRFFSCSQNRWTWLDYAQ